MKTTVIIAIVLVVLGVLSLAYQGFTYTTRDKAVDLGPLQITTEQTHTVPLPPILGALALVGGVILLIATNRRGIS